MESPPDQPDKFFEDLTMNVLTINEVAAALKLSRSKVYELVSVGKLASLKIDGAVRVLETDLLSYLESCRQMKTPQKPRRRIPRLKHLKLS